MKDDNGYTETLTDDQLMMHFISTSVTVQDGRCFNGVHLFMYANRLDYHNKTIAIKHPYVGQIGHSIELPEINKCYRKSICWQEKLRLFIKAYIALEGEEADVKYYGSYSVVTA